MPHRIDRKSQASSFHLALSELTVDQQFLLQVIHDLRKVPLEELCRFYHSGTMRRLRLSLNLLELRKLIVQVDDTWSPTWLGDGAVNWRQQILCAEGLDLSSIARPRAGENGYLLGPPCTEYRSALFAPGYCWCCRPQADHLGEYLKAAEALIRPG